MPKITFTKEHLLMKTQLEANWYKVKIKETKEGPGKTDPTSTVYTISTVVAEGPATGVPITTWLTEKMPEKIVAFVDCFVNGGAVAGKEYDLKDTENKLVMAYIKYNVDRSSNEITEFKPAKA